MNTPLKKVLVTGATGLVGRFVVKQLLEEGYYIKAFAKIEEKFIHTLPTHPSVEWIPGDILDLIDLEKAMEDVEYIVHAAAFVSLNPFKRKEVLQINVEGTANVINLALKKNIKKFIHLSSVTTIGYSEKPIKVDEKNKIDVSLSNLAYAQSKILSEREAWRGATEGLPVIILNPSTIIGPGDWERGSTQLFKYVSEQHKFYVDGIFNYVDVRDLSKAISLLLKSDLENEQFIVTAGTILYKDLFAKIANEFQVKPPSIKIPKLIMRIIAFFETIKQGLFKSKKDPIITKEMIHEASNKSIYLNEKIKKQLSISFHSIDETIPWVCEELRKKIVK